MIVPIRVEWEPSFNLLQRLAPAEGPVVQFETSSIEVLDFEPETSTFREDIVTGLSRFPKTLPSRYFYDRRGSQLFDQICELDEYYVTRSELAIMKEYADEMAEQIGPGTMLIEYGSGSSIKTRLLLDHLEDTAAYVPVDISRKHLHVSAEELSGSYPDVQVLPICADFTQHFNLPIPDETPTHCAVYFPGSTIGNFQPHEAVDLLSTIVQLCGTGGGLLIGIDLKKDIDKLHAAYNDSEGVTAEFNLNLLHRINQELDANFDLDQFQHSAIYNETRGRIEMHLVSESQQQVVIGEDEFQFEAGETICTEYSHKYTVEEFEAIASEVGLSLHKHWTDDENNFAVLHLVVEN